MSKRKATLDASKFDVHDECQYSWSGTPGDYYLEMAERGLERLAPPRGPHSCIKHPTHVDDPTNDDHRCCCGTTTWIP